MSLISTINDFESNQLTSALVKAVDNAVRPGGKEPDIVARITANVPRELASIKRVGSYSLSVGGIFVHQKPKVWFDGMTLKNIELGDLLVISTVIPIDGAPVRKAILYQAKMFDEIPVNDPKNEDQHVLYRDWPVYKYVHAELKDKMRRLHGYDLYDSAKYLLLRKKVNTVSGWPNWLHSRLKDSNTLTAHPSSPLNNYECFIKELFSLVLSDAGKSFHVMSDDEYERTSDDHHQCCDEIPFLCWVPSCILDCASTGWNLMVNDLLRTIPKAKTPPMGRASGRAGAAPRGVNISYLTPDSTLKYFVGDSLSDDFPPNHNETELGGDEPEDSGINVIEFVLTETENNQEIRPDEFA